MLRGRDAVLRFGFAVLPLALRVAPARLALVEGLARDVLALLAALLLPAFVEPGFARDGALRVADLRAPALRDAVRVRPSPPLTPPPDSSDDHLPDMTR